MEGGLLLGFSAVLAVENLFYCFVGTLAGTLVGVLPGIGPLAGIAVLLPVTYGMDPLAALIMLAGVYYGAQYGASTTSILLRVPGDAAAVVTALDGHELARQGRAGPALALAALGSFFAGTVATLLIAIAAPPLAALALRFGPADYFSMIVLGLVASAALTHGTLVKGIAMVALGLAFGLVGIDINTGTARFTFGQPELYDGVSLVAMIIGVFGFSQIIGAIETTARGTRQVIPVERLMPSREDFRQAIVPAVRGATLGSFLGVLPGGGATLSSFASYTIEKKLSRRPQEFGRGAIAGLVGPESANNAAAQTSFIPLLTLGIPPNAVIALLGGAMLLQGITPGPDVISSQPRLFWGVVASMWIGNLMLLVLNLPLIGVWVRILRIPYRLLYPAVLVFASLGVYALNNSTFDVLLAAGFGVLGWLLLKLRFEPAPLVLGFILGPMLEENFRRAMLLSRGDPSVFLTEPISLGMLSVVAIMLVALLLPIVKRGKDAALVGGDDA